jgi:hypothetical protein
LISVHHHQRNQGCSFLADNDGCYLTFPTFSITVDDSTDCLLAYEIVIPKGFDLSTCNYLQNEPDQIETLALTKTRRLEEKWKSRSPVQQNNTQHCVAWKLETRASLCR